MLKLFKLDWDFSFVFKKDKPHTHTEDFEAASLVSGRDVLTLEVVCCEMN